MSIFSANTSDMSYTGKVIRELGDEYKTNINSIFTLIDNLGNKYLVSGSGTYDLQGNFTVNYVMKNASTGTTYQTGTHTFKKKAQ